MRLPEQRFWDRLRPNLKQGGVRVERIENLVGVGFPDMIALCCGTVTMCELKAVEEPPARLSTALLGDKRGLSVDQRNWHLSWNKYGGRSIILIACGSHHFFTIDGKLADKVNAMTLAELAVNSLASRWAELRTYLGSAK